MPTYPEAFGLTDNPFSPSRLIEGVMSPFMMKSISINPLRLDADDGLLQLYVGGAGPFDEHFRAYQDKLEVNGYVENTAEVKSSIGINSFIFFIHGPIGTGKTTLMNLMLRSLKRCTPPSGAWTRYEAEWGFKQPPSTQTVALEALKEKIEKRAPGDDYCFVILDDLVQGASESAFNLFKHFEDKCLLFMFITTSDSGLREKTWANWPLPIVSYQTAALSPDNAVAFLRSRVNLFRHPLATEFLAGHELFPFSETNVREAVKARSVAYDSGTKIITIRQFSQALSSFLETRRTRTARLFNGGPVASAQLNEAEIDLIAESKEIYERVAA